MKKKDLEQIAEEIALNTKIIEHSTDKTEIKRAEHNILELSGRITSVEDFFFLDDLIQDFLTK